MREVYGESPNVLDANQFEPDYLTSIFRRAEEFSDLVKLQKAEEAVAASFVGKLAMYRYFSEPSTRTHDSSMAAADVLGMSKIGTAFAKISSSDVKGEPLKDTIRTINEIISSVYAGGIIVMRHPEVGSAHQSAEVSRVPIINAGDGQNEHPTQALLDVFTIKQHFKELKGLHVVMGGDPRYSRTIHSLVEALSTLEQNIKFTFLAGTDLWLDEVRQKELQERGIDFSQTDDFEAALKSADVFYMTRLQQERIEEPSKDDPEYEKKMEEIVRAKAEYEKYYFQEDSLEKMKDDAMLLHPLPQTGEVEKVPAKHPKNYMWRQIRTGPRIRAAVFENSLYYAQKLGWYDKDEEAA